MILVLLILLVLLHFLDMLFTVLYLEKVAKKHKNAYKLELNFHRYFFKKFGFRKGGLLSYIISAPILFFVGWSVADTEPIVLVFMLGLVFGIVYVNFVSWYTYDETMKVVNND